MQKNAPEVKFICAACGYKTNLKYNFRRHRDSHSCFLRRHRFPQDIVRLIMCYANEKLFIDNIDFSVKYDIVCSPNDSKRGLSFYVRQHRRLREKQREIFSTPVRSVVRSRRQLRNLLLALLSAVYRLSFFYS